MTNFFFFLHNFLLGPLTVILVIAVGCYLSIRSRFVQFRLFPRALSELLKRLRRGDSPQGVSPFQALCTALAATAGTGNLVGVAGALCLGGPGALFWMWLCGLLGMATKFAEVTLALRYRVKKDGACIGGPMYMIPEAMGERYKSVAVLYALFGVAASFGIGNTAQINAVVSALSSAVSRYGGQITHLQRLGLGILIAAGVGLCLFGGARRIGQVAEVLVPFLSLGYILLCCGVLILRMRLLPDALSAVFTGIFRPEAVTGGAIGSCFTVLKTGCARGVFTNEAGMGTGSIAHAGVTARHPAEQGLMGILEVFLDTNVMCTLTGLAILVSGVPIPYGKDLGAELSSAAFSTVLGNWVSVFLTVCLCCFAFATVLGWGLYGARCAQYLFGTHGWGPYALAQTLLVIPGALMNTETLWQLSEILNGAMAIPNLITLAMLTPELCRLTIEYERKSGEASPEEVAYADFHQRQPL